MCKQATEIQKLWKPKEGDWCFVHNEIHLVCEGDEWQHLGNKRLLRPFCDYGDPAEDFDWYENQIKESIWLPRQDQLQKMIDALKHDANNPTWNKAFRWFEWTKVHYNEFDTFKKLWLSFMMFTKYNKKWNETEWVKDNSNDKK